MLSCAVDSTVYRTSRPERHSIEVWGVYLVGCGLSAALFGSLHPAGAKGDMKGDTNEGAKIETGGSDEEEEEEEERKRGELVSFVFGISVFFSLLSEI